MDIEFAIGKRIAELRNERKLSQEKLATLADLHEDYIGKIERGERCPSIKRLNAILQGLNITLSDFFKSISQ